jgi:hypothetical protein
VSSSDRVREGWATGTELKAGAAGGSRAKAIRARPTCAVCHRPVEEFTEEVGYLDRFVVFTARCHGEVERARVEMEMAEDGRLDFGLAFVPKNVLAGASERRALPPAPEDV